MNNKWKIENLQGFWDSNRSPNRAGKARSNYRDQMKKLKKKKTVDFAVLAKHQVKWKIKWDK